MHKYQVWTGLHRCMSTEIIRAKDGIEAIKEYAKRNKKESLELIFAEEIDEKA